MEAVISGRKMNVSIDDTYAAVYKGKPYKALQNKYHLIFMENNNLLYRAILKVNPKELHAMLGGALFGLMGAVVNLIPGYEEYLFGIDHYNGNSVPIKQIVRGARF